MRSIRFVKNLLASFYAWLFESLTYGVRYGINGLPTPYGQSHKPLAWSVHHSELRSR